jgi:hypothetical protein
MESKNIEIKINPNINIKNKKDQDQNLKNINKLTNTYKVIPYHIFENDILSYFNTSDLFFKLRTLSTQWYKISKQKWEQTLENEFRNHLNLMDLVKEKEESNKTYDIYTTGLDGYKTVIKSFRYNTDVLNEIRTLLTREYFNDQQIKNLLKVFFKFLKMEQAYDLLEKNGENSCEDLKKYLLTLEINNFYVSKIDILLPFGQNYKDITYLLYVRSQYEGINKAHLENISPHAVLIYLFTNAIVEYQIMKVKMKDLKEKAEIIDKKIEDVTIMWHKKKRFIENASRIISNSSITTPRIRFVLKLFEKNNLRHPLNDYDEEIIKCIMKLKEFFNINDLNNDNKKDSYNEEIISNIYVNIWSRRSLLTKKIMILERYSELYEKFITRNLLENVSENTYYINNKLNDNFIDIDSINYDDNDNDNDFIYDYNYKFKVGQENFNLKQFLFCLYLNSLDDKKNNITEESLLKIKYYLDNNFVYENDFYNLEKKLKENNNDNDNISEEIKIYLDDFNIDIKKK